MQIRHDGLDDPLSLFPGHFCHFPQFSPALATAKLRPWPQQSIRHSPRPHASRQQVVERAEAFLVARIGESVSIADLCRVAGVSERSLRNAFYDVRGMSPKRCVVRARLAEVRRALSDADGARGAVTTIATDYGFFELGRFASTYKSMFGESPSDTLRGHAGREAMAS